MPNYDYLIEETGEVVNCFQSIKDEKLTTVMSPKKKKELPCHRIISENLAGIVFQGNGWTINSKSRGYSGKFSEKLRSVGTPVEAPSHKADADRFLQHQIDNGMLDNVSPSMKFAPGATPMTGEQMIDKKHKPK